jgi:hypothetical protein
MVPRSTLRINLLVTIFRANPLATAKKILCKIFLFIFLYLIFYCYNHPEMIELEQAVMGPIAVNGNQQIKIGGLQ